MKRILTALALAVALAAVGTTAAASATSAGSPGVTPTTTISAAPGVVAPITNGPMTVTLVDSYFSTAATQLIVVLEVSATAAVNPGGYSAVYVGPDGQQVDVAGQITPDQIFPGATSLIVLAFPAATPGGNVILPAYDDDYNELDVTIPVPAE